MSRGGGDDRGHAGADRLAQPARRRDRLRRGVGRARAPIPRGMDGRRRHLQRDRSGLRQRGPPLLRAAAPLRERRPRLARSHDRRPAVGGARHRRTRRVVGADGAARSGQSRGRDRLSRALRPRAGGADRRHHRVGRAQRPRPLVRERRPRRGGARDQLRALGRRGRRAREGRTRVRRRPRDGHAGAERSLRAARREDAAGNAAGASAVARERGRGTCSRVSWTCPTGRCSSW